jgi:hypothetical protein
MVLGMRSKLFSCKCRSGENPTPPPLHEKLLCWVLTADLWLCASKPSPQSVQRAGRRRAGRGWLRVILHAEDGPVGQTQPSTVPSFRLRWVTMTLAGSVCLVHRVVVILRRDLHVGGIDIADRLVAAVMAELELVGAPPNASPMIWWPRQMPKVGMPAVQQVADGFGGIGHARRVARAVAQKDAVRVQRQHFCGGVCAGTTVTRRPWLVRRRRMLCLMPKS